LSDVYFFGGGKENGVGKKTKLLFGAGSWGIEEGGGGGQKKKKNRLIPENAWMGGRGKSELNFLKNAKPKKRKRK